MMTKPDRTLAAAGLILVYATVIGFTDNYVRVIAEGAGLWQFHFTRTCMAMVLLALVAVPLRLRLRPVNLRAVLARSSIHGLAMVIYFGALAFLDVALVAAGLFTAPIWVLLISRFVYGHAIGPVRILAVILGFAGVVLVLGPEAMAGASLPAVLPVLAGFFLALGIIGAVGMAVLWVLPLEVPAGPEGFLQRGPVWASGEFYFWTFVQAAGSLIGVGFMIRAYQITDASRASVLEYVILPASAFWTWVIWGKGLEPLAVLGMVLIVAAGTLIALRAKAQEA